MTSRRDRILEKRKESSQEYGGKCQRYLCRNNWMPRKRNVFCHSIKSKCTMRELSEGSRHLHVLKICYNAYGNLGLLLKWDSIPRVAYMDDYMVPQDCTSRMSQALLESHLKSTFFYIFRGPFKYYLVYRTCVNTLYGRIWSSGQMNKQRTENSAPSPLQLPMSTQASFSKLGNTASDTALVRCVTNVSQTSHIFQSKVKHLLYVANKHMKLTSWKLVWILPQTKQNKKQNTFKPSSGGIDL